MPAISPDQAALTAHVRAAVAAAAERLRKDAEVRGLPALGENKDLRPAMREALQARFGDEAVLQEKRLWFPNWQAGNGSLGGVDLLVLDGAGDFAELLDGGPARPGRVPALIETRLVADEEIAHPADNWRLRAIRARPASEEWLPFDDGWPVGHWKQRAKDGPRQVPPAS